jgi:AcrR family transcriptional regulator
MSERSFMSSGPAATAAKRLRRSRPESARRRLAILDAAARAIARHGFHGMSMRELARSTGQSPAAFYNHFASKSEVLLQIQVSAFETLISSTEEAVRGLGSAREQLLAFFQQNLRYLAAHPEVMRVLVHEAGTLPARDRAEVRKLKGRYYDLGRSIVAGLLAASRRRGRGPAARPDARGELELERRTYGVFGMMNWAYGWYRPTRHGTPAELARSLRALALHGLAGARVAGR